MALEKGKGANFLENKLVHGSEGGARREGWNALSKTRGTVTVRA